MNVSTPISIDTLRQLTEKELNEFKRDCEAFSTTSPALGSSIVHHNNAVIVAESNIGKVISVLMARNVFEGSSGILETAECVNSLSRKIHSENITAGWWDEVYEISVLSEKGLISERLKTKLMANVIASKMALMHSELSEALEGMRKGLADDKLPHRPMIEVEFADAIIRILDTAGHLNLDVGGAIIEKLRFNSVRPDHKRENREKEGGKKI